MSLFICSANDKVNLIVENQIIDNSKCEQFLGVKFDFKLTFNAHFDDISKKAGLKLNILSRTETCLDFNRKQWMRSSYLNSFIVLWFGCVIIAQNIKQIEYMKDFFVYYIMAKNHLLKMSRIKTNLSLYTSGILQSKCIKYIMVFHQEL